MIDGELRGLFRKALPHFHWQSIESGSTGLGIPDSNYCVLGREGWVEFKKIDGWKVTLRPAQVGWLLRRVRAGGRCFVAVRRKGEELYLFRGADAHVLLEQGIRSADPLGAWMTRRSWDWGEVGRILQE